MNVGVLALQGCVDHHVKHLKLLGVNALKIRTSEDLKQIERIILPGGESSTMLNLLKRSNLWNSLKEFVSNKPTWGICAGAILLANEVVNPCQDSLSAIPIRAHRNFYGSQLDSFNTEILIHTKPEFRISVDFIRAPKLEPLANCQVLATHQNTAVLIQSGKVLASSFHTELGDNSLLHKYFLAI